MWYNVLGECSIRISVPRAVQSDGDADCPVLGYITLLQVIRVKHFIYTSNVFMLDMVIYYVFILHQL